MKRTFKEITGWSAPFAPWVIQSWKEASEANGWDKTAARVKRNYFLQLEKLRKKAKKIPP